MMLYEVFLSVCLTSVCRVHYIRPKSRTERPKKTKIGTEVAHVTHDSDTTFKVIRSKVKVIRPLWLAVLAGQHEHRVSDRSICVYDVYRVSGVTTCRPGRGAYCGGLPLNSNYIHVIVIVIEFCVIMDARSAMRPCYILPMFF